MSATQKTALVAVFCQTCSRQAWNQNLGRTVSLRVTTSAIRTVEKHGGLDAFLMQARNAELADEARALKREMLAASASA